ncbi:helix-turn-helix domain-containing protein [Paenarthrobacter nicotinovorans]
MQSRDAVSTVDGSAPLAGRCSIARDLGRSPSTISRELSPDTLPRPRAP